VAEKSDRADQTPAVAVAKPTREEILAALEAASDPSQAPDDMRSRIIIKPDGEVIIENLSIDLMELALILDPDSEIGCGLPQEPEEDTKK